MGTRLLHTIMLNREAMLLLLGAVPTTLPCNDSRSDTAVIGAYLT